MGRPRPEDARRGDEDDDDEEVDFLDPSVDEDDSWTEEVAEDARTDLTDEEYREAVASDPPVGLIIGIAIVVALAAAVLLLR